MKKNEVPTRANPRTNLEYTLNGEKPVKKDHIPFIGNVQNREIYRYRSLMAQRLKRLPAMWETPVQFLGWEDPLEEGISPVAQSCPTLCDPMYCSKPGLPVHDQPLELAQAHVHRVGDAAQPSPPLPPLFLPPPILSPPPVFWPGESHGNLVAKSQTRLSDFHSLLACFPNRSSSGSGD